MNLWHNIKGTNIHIIGSPRRRREKGALKLFEKKYLLKTSLS